MLQLSRSVVIQSEAKGWARAELDFAALQHVFSLPSPITAANMSSNSGNINTDNLGSSSNTSISGSNTSSSGSNSTSTSSVTLTFSNLVLVNLPPGPPSTYPLGLSPLLMWSIDMDR
jgi:hypothetical protein